MALPTASHSEHGSATSLSSRIAFRLSAEKAEHLHAARPLSARRCSCRAKSSKAHPSGRPSFGAMQSSSSSRHVVRLLIRREKASRDLPIAFASCFSETPARFDCVLIAIEIACVVTFIIFLSTIYSFSININDTSFNTFVKRIYVFN